MKFSFRKKSKEKSTDEAPVVADAVVDVEEQQEPEVDYVAQAEDIRELLGHIATEEKPNVQDTKIFERAFSKAARAVLEHAELATAETVQAFVDYAGKVNHAELRYDGVARLGAIAVQYPDYADLVVQTLQGALTDKDEEVRHAAVYSLRGIGETNPDQMDTVVKMLTEATKSQYRDVREDSILGLTSLAVKNQDYADGVVATLSGLLSDPSDGKNGQQFYRVRIKAARQLGVIGMANDDQVDNVLDVLETGLADKDLFVRYRSIDSMEEIAKKHADKVERVVASMEASKESAVFVVKERINKVVHSLNPPPKPVKTAAEIAEEKKQAAARKKELDAAAKEQQKLAQEQAKTAQQKKDRMDAVKRLANNLPGKKL
jgi:HEAT repeat protein